MESRNKNILVYANWKGLSQSTLLGVLSVQLLRGKEVFSFEYDSAWLQSNFSLVLDPSLGFFSGKQFLSEGKINFGLFLDSSPDRWGRLLMRRREAILAKQEERKERTLFEADYLLGVFDEHRVGGLRFKVDAEGDYVNNHRAMATPPWAMLRELENASLQLEKEDAVESSSYTKWLSLLVDPGSSLGGARPKSSVLDEKGNLWIAKFPSAADEKNVGLWEYVAQELAKKSGIIVPAFQVAKFSKKHHTFLSKRFDRENKNTRIHFASAMNLLGYTDGANSEIGASYLELVSFIMRNGALVKSDLEQLWRRIVFSILISNTDDHLRNHGFLLSPLGWHLSPAYDLNPNEFGRGLTLNIDEHSNEMDTELALSVAKYFKLSAPRSKEILREVEKVVSTWNAVAKNAGLTRSEIDSMSSAFHV